MNESPYPCIVHFDGKTLIELNKGKTIKSDRLSVLVNIEGETNLLGVPPLPSSSGDDQSNGVMDLLKEYKLESKVGGICFDTTASNTGLKKGSLIRISNKIGKFHLLIVCRKEWFIFVIQFPMNIPQDQIILCLKNKKLFLKVIILITIKQN